MINIKIKIEKESLNDVIKYLQEKEGVECIISTENNAKAFEALTEQDNEEINDVWVLENENVKINDLSSLMKLSHSLFERLPERFNWELISFIPDLSEEFIERNLDKLSTKIISARQLSEEFIIKNHDKLDISILLWVNEIPEELEEELKNDIEQHKLQILGNQEEIEEKLEEIYTRVDIINQYKRDIENAGLEINFNTNPLQGFRRALEEQQTQEQRNEEIENIEND